MEKRINRLRNKSFEKTLLDEPVPNKKVKFSLRGNKPKLETIKLPEPLKPIKYIPPKPISKPRIRPRLKPVLLPRRKPSSRPRPKPQNQ